MGCMDEIRKGNPVVFIKSGDKTESFKKEDDTLVTRTVPCEPEEMVPDLYCVPGKEAEALDLLAKSGVIELWRPTDDKNKQWEKVYVSV